MKIIFLFPTLCLLLLGVSGCGIPTKVLIPAISTSAQTTAPQSGRTMWASKDTVLKGDDFQLYFALPHGECLGVIDPSGHFFYVVFPAQYGSGTLQPLVSSEQFATTTSLNINPLTFKCDPYIYEVYENQTVFTQSGTYRFLLGDNLHADDTDRLAVLKIEYFHTEHPMFATK